MSDPNVVADDLIDVSGMTLDEIEGIERPALRRALRRLLDSDEDDTGPIAGFGQRIDGASEAGGGHPK